MNFLVRLIESSRHPLLSFPYRFIKYRLQFRGETQRARPKNLEGNIEDNAFREMSFTFAIIAIAAQLACVDGPLTPAKYVAFREGFPLKGRDSDKIRSLFLLACDNPAPYTHYVMQLHYLFTGRQGLFVSVMDRLFDVAAADGPVSPAAEEMLSRIAHMLKIGSADYAKLHARHLHPKPHQVLGVAKGTPSHRIKQRYRELMQKWHPDRFAGEKVSPEVELLLKMKASEISEAYHDLRKKSA